MKEQDILGRFENLEGKDWRIENRDGYPNLIVNNPIQSGGETFYMISDAEHTALSQIQESETQSLEAPAAEIQT